MPQSLNDYMKDVQTFLRDSGQDLLDPEDIIKHVNRARREIALKTQCVRILTPITGAVIAATVTAGGTNYSNNPTLTITPPDFPSGMGANPTGAQATASAVVVAGVINAIDITYGGAGYWQPTITITDTTGHGATATLQVSALNQTAQGQEVYNFNQVDLSPFPGVESIYAIQSVSLLYSGFRYSLIAYSFSTNQALVRQWAQSWQYVPAVCAQHGQGTAGTFYLYPVPSMPFQMEWDCYCLPIDLTTDLSVEVIPDPWTDAVAYRAAHLAYVSIEFF